MNTLLGDGMSSRCFRIFANATDLRDSVYSFLNMMRDTGSFGVYLGTDKKHIEQALDLVSAELNLLRTKPIAKAELQRTKAQLKGSMLLGLESTSARMMRLGTGETVLWRVHRVGDNLSRDRFGDRGERDRSCTTAAKGRLVCYNNLRTD